MPSSAVGARGGWTGAGRHALDPRPLRRRDRENHSTASARSSGRPGVQAGPVRGQAHGYRPDVRIHRMRQIFTTVRSIIKYTM